MGQEATETRESHQREIATFNSSLQGGDLKSLEASEQWLLKLEKLTLKWKSCRYLWNWKEEKSLWWTLQFNSQYSVYSLSLEITWFWQVVKLTICEVYFMSNEKEDKLLRCAYWPKQKESEAFK